MEEDAAPDGEAEAGMADKAAEPAAVQAEAEVDGLPERRVEDPTEEPAVPQMRLADAQNGDPGVDFIVKHSSPHRIKSLCVCSPAWELHHRRSGVNGTAIGTADLVPIGKGQHKFPAPCLRLTGSCLIWQVRQGVGFGSLYMQLLCRRALPVGRKIVK